MKQNNFNYNIPKSYVLGFIFGGILLGMLIIVCLLYAFKNSISFYRTPSQIKEIDYKSSYNFRIGGYVVTPVVYSAKNKCVSFDITDDKKQIKAYYCGFIPSLFRIGQGVVVDGCFNKQVDNSYLFIGKQLLTKHDEKYHPPKKI